jgi:uncharacterized protein (DUF885 family)
VPKCRLELLPIAFCLFLASPGARAQQPRLPAFHYDPRAEGWLAGSRGFDMAAAVQRYSTDASTLDRFYDDQLSPERDEAFAQFDASWQSLLEQVPFDSLDAEGRVDWLLLRARLRLQEHRRELAKEKRDEMSRLIPFAGSILALDDNLRRMTFINGADAAKQVSQVGSQLATLTEQIESAQLTATPTVARRASRAVKDLQFTLKRWHDFYNGYDPAFTWWIAEPWEKVDAALGSYGTLISEKIAGIKAADKDTILGDPAGAAALENALAQEFIPYTPDELIARARVELAWCQQEMVRNAREMGLGDDWHRALEHAKNDYVGPGDQPAKVRDLEYEAIEFIQKRDLIAIPEPAIRLWRIAMMSPERQRINPFFTGGELLTVSYPTAAMTEDQKLMSMRGNNIHYARATVFHEMIPGHFLQQYMTDRYHPWRRAFATPFWEEGWAFYWELLLWDEGFARSPADRIGMLFWRMHRAARVIFSLNFHLGRMTAAEAVSFLIKEVGHEPENAAAEVRRSFETDEYGPLYQCAYEIGAMQFRALHAELVGSGKMTNRQFHDTVLRLGPMPVEMVRASLMGTRLPKDFRPSWKFFGEGVN